MKGLPGILEAATFYFNPAAGGRDNSTEAARVYLGAAPNTPKRCHRPAQFCRCSPAISRRGRWRMAFGAMLDRDKFYRGNATL